MKRLSIIPILFPFVLIFTTGCHNKADLTVAPPFPSQSPWLKCSKDTIFFENSVLPLVINSCGKSGCHDQSGARDISLMDYSGIMKIVSPGNPQSSRLYTSLFDFGNQKMPRKGQSTVNEEGLIYYWIQQGAINNKCETPCDSSHVTYDSAIVIITQSWCVTCHSESNPAHNLSLTTYEEVVASVNSTRLLGAILQEPGYSAMPKSSQLSPCDVAIFQKWIRLGMPR